MLEMLRVSVHQMSWEMTHLDVLPYLPRANGINHRYFYNPSYVYANPVIKLDMSPL